MIRSSGESRRPKLGLTDGASASGGQPGFFGLYGRPVSAGWMVTFADLLALLVSFFVLLFATTTVEPEAWRRVVQPMRPYVAGTVLHPQGRPPAEPAAPSPGHDLNYPEVLLRQLQDTHPGLGGMGIDRREHALVLHMPDGALRMAGPAPGPGASMTRAQADLARLLAALDNRLEVVVHASPDAVVLTQGAPKDPGAPWRRALGEGEDVASLLAAGGVDKHVTVTVLLDQPMGAAHSHIDLVLHDLGNSAAKEPSDAP